MTADQTRRKLYCIMATMSGVATPKFLDRQTVLSAAYSLTEDFRYAATFSEYDAASRVLDVMADFGAFPDYLLTVAEVERVAPQKGKRQ